MSEVVSRIAGRGTSRVWLVALLVLAALGCFSGAANAAAGPFNPAQPTVFISQGTTTQLEAATQSGGSIIFTNVGSPTPGVTYNAIAYDTCNNYIYGVQTSTGNGGTPGSIIRIASDGSISYPGINVGTGFNVGAFDGDASCDHLYVGTSGTSSLTLVNLATSNVSTVAVGSKGPDMTYAGGYFWSMAGVNQIQRISVTPGALGTTTFTVSTPAVNGKLPGGTFGAAWTYGNGNVGFSDNSTGNIYQLSIANPGSANPTFTTVLSQAGPSSGVNDGTNAPGLSTDLGITKTASPAMVDPGGSITYTLNITNYGPGQSSGFALNDSLPTGLTNVATTTPGCQITASNVSCPGNPLASGSSQTVTITANAPTSNFTTAITNTATVTANELDPNPANNTASSTVKPNIVTVSIAKTATVTPASDQNDARLGDTIQYSYKVTNTGNVPLVKLAVSDPTAGSVTCPTPTPPGLAVGASETCVADAPYVVAQTDVDAGSVTDTATATGTDTTGFTSAPSAPATATIQTVPAAPSLSLRKIADASLGDSTPIVAGETVQYSYELTNTGNVDLKSLSVSDPTAGAVTCPNPGGAGLAPDKSELCTANGLYTITQADVDSGGLLDTAVASGTDAQSQTVKSDPSSVLLPSSPAPVVAVAKSATVSPPGDQDAVQVGDTISYSYMVTNIGNVTLKSLAVSDPGNGAVTCPTPSPPGLAPGKSEICAANATYTVTQADVDAGAVVDTATATGTDTRGNVSAPSDPSTIRVPAVPPAPAVSINKTATVDPAADQNAAKVGDTISYSYTVKNTGNVTLKSVAVNDPTNGDVTCPAPAAPGLAPGASETCTADATHTVTQADVDAGSVEDTATATGIDTQDVPSAPSASSAATVDTVAPAPAVSIDKHATVNPGADAGAVEVGDRIQYSYTVKNTGNVTLASVAVDDPNAGAVDCPTPAAPGLAPGASETCTAATPHTVTQADVDAGSVTDTATATGTDTNGNTSDPSAPSSVTVQAALPQPSVSIVKTGNAANGNDAPLTTGEEIDYSYLVTNTGNVTLKSITVTDDKVATVNCPTPAAPGLAPGASETCTGTYTVTAADAENNSITNKATAVATDTNGDNSPPATDSLTLPSATPAPTVAISKSGSVSPPADQNVAQLGDHISYSYEVTNTGNVNLSSVAVTDDSAGSVTCPAVPAGGLAPGASETCTADTDYEVTQADVDHGSVLDTATATGTATVDGNPITSPESDPSSVEIPTLEAPAVLVDKTATVTPAANQDGAKVDDTIQYTYTVHNVGDVTLKSIAVEDPTAGTVDCPTPAAPGLAPGSDETCTAVAARTVTQADVDAGTVDDTATATGTDTHGLTSPEASSSATVATVLPDPTLSLAKHATVTPASDQNHVVVGDKIDYRYVVTNTGNVTLASISVTDPQFGAVSCPALSGPGLAPRASLTCAGEKTYTVTQADVDNGGVTDRGEASGADTNGNMTPIAQGTVTVPAVRTPRVSLTKTATVAPAADQGGAKVGDGIAYSFRVTNTGNVDLTSISVSDQTLGAVACPIPAPPGLAPGRSETCESEVDHIVSKADQAAGKVTNTATAKGVDGAGQTSPAATASATVKVVGAPPPPVTPTAQLIVHKQVNHAKAYPGQPLTYSITVHNAGPDAAKDVTLTDTPSMALKVTSVKAGGHHCTVASTVTCSLGTIDVGHTVRITIVATVTRAGTEHNTATAHSSTKLVHPKRAHSTVTTKVTPVLRLHKRALRQHAKTGQNVTYKITVSNPTVVAIGHVTVCDTLPHGLGLLRASPHASARSGSPCWRITRLGARHSRTLTLLANVEPGVRGRLINHAHASAPGVRRVSATAPIHVTRVRKSPCVLPSARGAADANAASGATGGHGPVARPAC